MKKIGLFWGSRTNNTKRSAYFIKNHLELQGFQVDIFDVAHTGIDKLLCYQSIIIGCSTWHTGDLQKDWDGLFVEFSRSNFVGTTAAFFGCGGQYGRSNTFIDAVGILARCFIQNGGNLVGRCDAREYCFESSLAYDCGSMLGLGLDYTNHQERCERQMLDWICSLSFDFGSFGYV